MTTPNDSTSKENNVSRKGDADNGVFDPLAVNGVLGLTDKRPRFAEPIGKSPRTDGVLTILDEKREDMRSPMVQFLKPSEIRNYTPPKDQNMAGDYHLQRGAMSVLAGPPGCGKSRASLSLAIQGAKGNGEWMGLDVHGQFRTLVLQAENGLSRLHRDMQELDLPDDIDDWIRISSPPQMGLDIEHPKLRSALKAVMNEFAPHLLIVDPWNALARDGMEKDYQEAFRKVREALPESPVNAACLIIHHLRKPKSEDKQTGRGLGNLMAGSYRITSVPRSIFVLQPATDDTLDNRLVFTVTKNNDGELGERSAWERGHGCFTRCEDFSWEDYDERKQKPRESKVKTEHLHALFENGKLFLVKAEAAKRLTQVAKIGRTAAYEALKISGGRYSDILEERPDKQIGLRQNTGGS